jgi:hypothetical protein
MMRWMGTSKIMHICRSIPHQYIQNHLLNIDRKILSAFVTKFTLSEPSPFSLLMMSLPLSMGGLGLCNITEIAPIAHFSSIASSLPFIQKKFNLTNNPGLTSAVSNTNTLKYFTSYLPILSRQITEDDFAPFAHLNSIFDLEHKKHLQHDLTGKAFRFKWKQHFELATEADQAHMNTRNNPYSSAIFKVAPLSSNLSLSDEDCRFSVAYATSIPLAESPPSCSCGRELSLEHMLSCGPCMLMRHNMLQKRIVSYCDNASVETEQNVREKILETIEEEGKSIKRCDEPDITFYWSSSSIEETDITVFNSTAPSRIDKSAADKNWGLNSIIKRKNDLYHKNASDRGNTFTPLAIESHGRMSSQLKSLLSRIITHDKTSFPISLNETITDLLFVLARGNALCAKIVGIRSIRHRERMRLEALGPAGRTLMISRS